MPELARRLGGGGEPAGLLPKLDSPGSAALALLGEAPTPALAFQYDALSRRLHALQTTLAGLSGPAFVELAYSVKTNPDVEVLKRVAQAGVAAEVISLGEAQAAVAQDCDAARIVANGPVKRLQDPRWPRIRIGFADSIEECEAWAANPKTLRAEMFGVRLRVSAHGSRFGVDVSLGAARRRLFELLEKLPADLKLGFSFHMSPSAIGVEGWRDCLHGLVDVIDSAPPAVKKRVQVLDLGGGWEPADRHILIETLLPELKVRLAAGELIPKHILVEFGRALVQDLAIYVCSVVEIRRQAHEIVVDGSALDLPDFISSPHGLAWLASDRSLHPVRQGEFALFGRTCMESDVLMRRIDAPPFADARLLIGDCGAYDFSMEPMFGLGRISRAFMPI